MQKWIRMRFDKYYFCSTPWFFFNKSSRWPLFLPDYFHLILKADWRSISSSNKQRQLKRKQNNLQILAWCCAPFSEPKTFTWQTEEIRTNKENCNISRHDLNGLIKLQKDNNICHWNHVTLVLVCPVVVYLRQVPAGIVSPPAFCWFVLKFFFPRLARCHRSTCFWTSQDICWQEVRSHAILRYTNL